jgi:hypothetical protein
LAQGLRRGVLQSITTSILTFSTTPSRNTPKSRRQYIAASNFQYNAEGKHQKQLPPYFSTGSARSHPLCISRCGKKKPFLVALTKEGQRPRSVLLPAVSMMMAVSPVAVPVPVVSLGYDPGTPIHHRRWDHDHGRSRDAYRRRIHDSRRGSNEHWGGVNRDANAIGYIIWAGIPFIFRCRMTSLANP